MYPFKALVFILHFCNYQWVSANSIRVHSNNSSGESGTVTFAIVVAVKKTTRHTSTNALSTSYHVLA
jgi:hypothetical protein